MPCAHTSIDGSGVRVGCRAPHIRARALDIRPDTAALVPRWTSLHSLGCIRLVCDPIFTSTGASTVSRGHVFPLPPRYNIHMSHVHACKRFQTPSTVMRHLSRARDLSLVSSSVQSVRICRSHGQSLSLRQQERASSLHTRVFSVSAAHASSLPA